MEKNTICKTVHQYNKEPIPAYEMKKLQEIAKDYRSIKNYVYERFGGIQSLKVIYPGYTVQKKMTDSGLRKNLRGGVPSVYFYLAVMDAVGDIKSQWTKTKVKIFGLVSRNGNFSAEDRHYLRFLLKVPDAFSAALNGMPPKLPGDFQERHDRLAEKTDAERLRRYLRRQVRKYHVKPHTEKADGFSIAERAYRYGNHGIYISTKEKRKRIFVPLTDNNRYGCRLYVKLYPEESRLEIKAPVQVTVKRHEDYRSRVGAALGMTVMLTADSGHRYGEELGAYEEEYAGWVREQTGRYSRNKESNPGRKKYRAQKRRLEERLHSYINKELNRFLREEKPQVVYIAKLPKPQGWGREGKFRYPAGMWQRGYILGRLRQKCREQSVTITEVPGRGIGRECSRCGAEGIRKNGVFICGACGYSTDGKTNTARNVLRRGGDVDPPQKREEFAGDGHKGKPAG